MSRITKDISVRVSQILTKKKTEELDVLKIQLKSAATAVVLTKIPENIYALFKQQKGSNYFRTTSQFQFIGKGVQFEYINTEILPYDDKHISVDDKTGEHLGSLINKIKTKKIEIEQLQIEISSALLGLRTYKNVERDFPEAFALLPVVGTVTALAVNISDIRAKL